MCIHARNVRSLAKNTLGSILIGTLSVFLLEELLILGNTVVLSEELYPFAYSRNNKHEED